MKPDVLVLAHDLPEVHLAVEVKLRASETVDAEIQLRAYMLHAKCPVALLVTPETTRIYHDTFASESPESIKLVLEVPTNDLLGLLRAPETERALVLAVSAWLERLSTGSASALPAALRDARNRVAHHLLPAVTEGRVLTTEPA